MMFITKALLPNSKRLILLDKAGWQGWDGAPEDFFERFDLSILDHTRLPNDSQVEVFEV